MMAWFRRWRQWMRVVSEVPKPRLPLDTARWKKIRAQGKKASGQ